jgi:hypothetical protein
MNYFVLYEFRTGSCTIVCYHYNTLLIIKVFQKFLWILKIILRMPNILISFAIVELLNQIRVNHNSLINIWFWKIVYIPSLSPSHPILSVKMMSLIYFSIKSQLSTEVFNRVKDFSYRFVVVDRKQHYNVHTFIENMW